MSICVTCKVHELVKHQADKMPSWQNVKLTNCQVMKMPSYENAKLWKCQVMKMSSWQTVKLKNIKLKMAILYSDKWWGMKLVQTKKH